MTSINERAEKICGKRDTPGMAFDLPWELGFRCPFCGASNEVNLEWSEYNMFIWCRTCDIDIPSCLCLRDTKKAIEMFLDCIEEVKKR